MDEDPIIMKFWETEVHLKTYLTDALKSKNFLPLAQNINIDDN